MKLKIILVMVLVMACEDASIVFNTYSAPDSEFKIEISYEEPWNKGNHKIVIYSINKNNKKKKLGNYVLKNDGKRLTNANVDIQWKINETVLVILKGEEQKNQVVNLKYKF